MGVLVVATTAHLWAAVGSVYVPDTDRFVGVARGGKLAVGRLNGRGEFTPAAELTLPMGPEGAMRYSGPPYDLIVPLAGGDPARPVYEYRSGALVPGRLTSDGWFVPTPGRRVVAFQEYRRTSQAWPIYNLPGRVIDLRARPAPYPPGWRGFGARPPLRRGPERR
jgi:hypothetical protein